MKVLVCDPISPEGVKMLKDAGLEVVEKKGVPPEELNELIGDFEAVIVRSATKVRKEQIERGAKLKAIGRGGVGVDNIDVDVAVSKGIQVLNTPTASSHSVAELAIGMMFALARHIVTGTMTMRDGKWEKKSMMGTELSGKTLGLLGFGNIGKETARIALALGMKVIACDITDVKSDLQVKFVDKDTVLKESDYISLHLPKAKDGKPVIGAEEFAKMKRSAYLINCARGGVVDEAALVQALKDGTIAGAGVDVFEKEPTDNTELVNAPNIITTPHLGASAREGQDRVGTEIAQRIIDALK